MSPRFALVRPYLRTKRGLVVMLSTTGTQVGPWTRAPSALSRHVLRSSSVDFRELASRSDVAWPGGYKLCLRHLRGIGGILPRPADPVRPKLQGRDIARVRIV